jgi:pimeloyl-ACP methyl ester carboxylesterase
MKPSLTMRAMMPHAGLVVFPASGHTPNPEEPDLFNCHVAELLADVDGGHRAGWRR